MFSRTLSSPTMPSALRSSGQNARPSRTAWAGCVKRTVWPCTCSVPESAASSPNIRRASSVRPEPSSPATPTTSPSCRSRLSGCSRRLAPKSRSDILGAEPSSADGLAGASASTLSADASATSRPTIAATSAGAGSCAGVHSPTKRPLRSTVMRSAIA